MTTPDTGIPVDAGQASQGIPQVPEQPTQTPPAAPEAQTPQVPAEIQARLAELEAKAAEVEKQARYHQSRADQAANQLKALVGAQQPQDPLQPYIDRFKQSHGLDDGSAKILAEMQYQNDQRFQQLQQAHAAQTQLPAAVYDVCRQDPRLMQVQTQVASALQTAILNGQVNPQVAFNPEYIRTIAASEFFKLPAGQSAPAPQPYNAQPPAFASMTGAPFGGFPQNFPQQSSQPQGLNPDAQRLLDQMNSYAGIPKKS